jgi:hypothetical protein
MAADAYCVAAIRIEMRRIHNCVFATAADVVPSIPMASFARNTTVEEWQPTVTIDGARITPLYGAHMTP